MQITEFDITIIGGGIAGAGVAQAASAAGYKVLLLEQGEFAQQTSCCSSKLIHGGLRYLESGQLNLVYNSLRERRALLRLAPSLVKPIPFYIPIYKNASRGKWTIRAGLSLYAILSSFEPLGRFKEVPKKSWSSIHGLNTENLVTIFQYWDAQTDDELLTHAVIASAQRHGVKTQNHAEFISAEKTEIGYQVSYQINYPLHSIAVNSEQFKANNVAKDNVEVTVKKNIHVNTAMIINASGPWVNQVLEKISPVIPFLEIDWVQGSHIIIDKPAPREVYYLESLTDKRVVFVMPWKGKTMVGTTEVLLTRFTGKITPSQDEIDYLYNIYQHYFPNERPEIINAFAGVRVLPKQKELAFNRPRESTIWQSSLTPQVISLYGGKLTTFRSTSKQVVALIQQQLGNRIELADIDTLPLLSTTIL